MFSFRFEIYCWRRLDQVKNRDHHDEQEGRWNYRRTSKVVLYSFYKNIVATLCLVVFMYPRVFWSKYLSTYSKRMESKESISHPLHSSYCTQITVGAFREMSKTLIGADCFICWIRTAHRAHRSSRDESHYRSAIIICKISCSIICKENWCRPPTPVRVSHCACKTTKFGDKSTYNTDTNTIRRRTSYKIHQCRAHFVWI